MSVEGEQEELAEQALHAADAPHGPNNQSADSKEPVLFELCSISSLYRMKTIEITEADYEALANTEESHFFDLKATAITGKKCQKIAIALANADGGDFIIGIADPKEAASAEERWQGTTIETFNSHIQALMEVKPQLPADYTFLHVDGRQGLLLRVTVEKSSVVHATAAGEVYLRKGAQSLKLTTQLIESLSFAKGATSFDDHLLTATAPEEVVDSHHLIEFLKNYAPQTSAFDFAFSQNLVDRNSFAPRVAGVLLFAANPSAFMPRKCAARIVRYTTKEDDPERDHLDSTVALEGSLYDLIKATVAKVTEIMSLVHIWTVDGLKKLDYPPEAVWEIIANAFLHRDYSISDDVQIRIFDNRLEVISPGRLPGYVTPENILSARFSRNSKIVRTLSRYPDAPNKDLGEGLNTAFQKMKDWQLKSPEIYQDDNYVRVVIPHISLGSATDSILEFLKTHSTINNRQAREITGIRSENAMKNEFYKLRDLKKLEMVPEKKGSAAAWRLVQDDLSGHGTPSTSP